MRKFQLLIKLFCVLIISLLLVSCGQVNLTKNDKEYLILPSDINVFSENNYKIIKLKDGKNYFFLKNTYLGERGCMYSVKYSTSTTNDCEYKLSIQLYKTTKRAKDMFKITKNNYFKILHKKSMENLDAKDYDVDNIALIKSDSLFLLSVSKDNIYYDIQIQGDTTSEKAIKDILKKKISYIKKNGIDSNKKNR